MTDKIELPATFLLIGKTKSGKTTFLKKFVEANRSQFDYCYVYTSIKAEEYYDLVPRQNVMSYDKLYVLDRFLVDNPHIKEKKRLVILDNFIGETKLEAAVLKMFTSGRHNNMTIVVLSQYMYMVPPTIRTNSSYVFVFKSSVRDLDALWNIQDQYEDQKQFNTFMRTNTRDYNPVLLMNFVNIGGEDTIIKLGDDMKKIEPKKSRTRRTRAEILGQPKEYKPIMKQTEESVEKANPIEDLDKSESSSDSPTD